MADFSCQRIACNVRYRYAASAADDARSTLEQMRELERERMHSFAALDETVSAEPAVSTSKKRRNVYDAQQHQQLPGKLVMSEHKPRSADVEVDEAYDGSGATFDFYAQIFARNPIDDRGMRLAATVHSSRRFDNAMWNGRQMVCGDGGGG